MRYRDLVAKGGWPVVPAGPMLRPGMTGSLERLQALRQRLAAEGIAVDSGAKPTVYSHALAGAVDLFQQRHGIVVDSALGGETDSSLNLPASYRLGQIAANMERYRWLPRTLGDRYVIVNVPAFHLYAYDSGQLVLQMKVVVGADYKDKATPVFSDSMRFVVFRPYWDITDDIARKETIPKIAADPGYMDANDLEYYREDGQQHIRQKPGPKNALGLVKFIFPNDFNVYLHDTPEEALFQKDVRAFSHGCIRLERPAELAQWVLGWPADKVQDAMQNGADNHRVNLPHALPVYIVYFTTYVMDGTLDVRQRSLQARRSGDARDGERGAARAERHRCRERAQGNSRPAEWLRVGGGSRSKGGLVWPARSMAVTATRNLPSPVTSSGAMSACVSVEVQVPPGCCVCTSHHATGTVSSPGVTCADCSPVHGVAGLAGGADPSHGDAGTNAGSAYSC